MKKEKAGEIVSAVTSLNAEGVAGKIAEAAQGFSAPVASATITHGKQATQTSIGIGGHPPDNASQVYVAKEGFCFAVTVWESSVSVMEKTSLADVLE